LERNERTMNNNFESLICESVSAWDGLAWLSGNLRDFYGTDIIGYYPDDNRPSALKFALAPFLFSTFPRGPLYQTNRAGREV
jgi:hypothetical protein